MISGADHRVSFDTALRAFEFDDQAFVGRTESGYLKWTAFEARVALQAETGEARAFYQKLLRELQVKRRSLFWEHEVGATPSILALHKKGVRMAVASEGDATSAHRGIFMIPGFGPDNRTFESVFRSYRPAEGEAIVAASLMGAGSYVPESIEDLSPEVLTDLYVTAVLQSFPNASEITLVGNSMGSSIAMAVAVKLGAEHGKKVNVVADNTIGTNVLSDMKPWLLQASRLIEWWEAGLKGALWMTLNVSPLRASLVDDWYGQTVVTRDEEIEIGPTEADLFYAESMAELPTPEGAYSYAGLLAAIGVDIDMWPQYYAKLSSDHGDWIGMRDGSMHRFDLHGGKIVFIDSTGNHFFPPEVTDRVYHPTEQSQPEQTTLIRRPGKHVPPAKSTRILEAIEIIRKSQ